MRLSRQPPDTTILRRRCAEMLKITACADDRSYLAKNTDMIKDYFPNHKIESAVTGFNPAESLMQCSGKKDNPDLFFLDIELRNQNGIDAVRNMTSYQKDSFVMNGRTVNPITRRYQALCLERFVNWQEIRT